MFSPVVVVIDDDVRTVRAITEVLRSTGARVRSVGAADAHAACQRLQPALVFIGATLSGGDAFDLVRALRQSHASTTFIVTSSAATPAEAAAAIKSGAWNYLPTPIDRPRLLGWVAMLRPHWERAGACESPPDGYGGLRGTSPAMRHLFGHIHRLAPYLRTALIMGETGTGKELVARARHRVGPRRSQPFVTVNCAAVTDTLFETAMFGHLRGAFTGAVDAKAGLFEAAHRGVLFLDEVGELSRAAQAKLLRILETGELQRVGATDVSRVDVLVLAATNRDLRRALKDGTFRRDLFHRLSLVELHVPPLRERRADIPPSTTPGLRTYFDNFERIWS